MPYCSKCKKDKEKMRTAKTCEECAEIGKRYYHSHKEKLSETNKIWRGTKNGKSKQQKASKKWRDNNRERYRELARLYTENNKTKPSYRLNKSRQKAKARGLDFLLSLEEYSNLISKPCYYCDGQLGSVITGVGLDRIDSSKGYLLDNVLPCCGVCNMVKGETFTVQETQSAINAILSLRKTLTQDHILS